MKKGNRNPNGSEVQMILDEIWYFYGQIMEYVAWLKIRQRHVANNCLELAVKYKMTDYEGIVVLIHSAFITLYGSRMLVSKKIQKMRPDIIELDKQTKRMCLSLDCRYIVLEETEVNTATSKNKKPNILTNCRSLEKLISMT
ncbi:hypothetical protein RFI_31386 [Reticulomyxa filosa]|uniref:Uncharacterized protein n=1 Tax=Reticulomyxa filosa TaxID=46433 RepID=X6LXC9_RETFI|nr:hypothetical protein RFI_31386 [Reticulomyxa filosa]|eukprot:ETO06011.1 hypothetical protein RFI_31386 [Reticulomyxa filosa]